MVYDQKTEKTNVAIHGTDDINSTFHAAFVYLTKLKSRFISTYRVSHTSTLFFNQINII